MRVRGLLLVLTSLILGIAAGRPVQAAAFGDCAPIGTLENFEADAPPTTRVFEAEDFRVVEGTEVKTVEKRGKTCLQHYGLKHGATRTTNLEIMHNYDEGLPSLGFRITNTNRSPDDDIYATLTKGGVEYWAHV